MKNGVGRYGICKKCQSDADDRAEDGKRAGMAEFWLIKAAAVARYKVGIVADASLLKVPLAATVVGNRHTQNIVSQDLIWLGFQQTTQGYETGVGRYSLSRSSPLKLSVDSLFSVAGLTV